MAQIFLPFTETPKGSPGLAAVRYFFPVLPECDTSVGQAGTAQQSSLDCSDWKNLHLCLLVEWDKPGEKNQ